MRDGENLRGFRRIVPTAGDGTLDLKAGESATVQLALDRTGATDTNATYGSVLAVRDAPPCRRRG